MSGEPQRRTQKERREATIAKLVEATITSLLENGYRGTTVKAICDRAGVSHGGLFRHFSSLLELVVEASEEVGRRQIHQFKARFAELDPSQEPLAAAVALIRQACRSPVNRVFYELLVAARTDRELHDALQPSTERYYAAILDVAKQVPGVERLPAASLEAVVFALVHLFDGESLTRTVYERPDAEAQRLELLTRAITVLIG